MPLLFIFNFDMLQNMKSALKSWILYENGKA